MNRDAVFTLVIALGMSTGCSKDSASVPEAGTTYTSQKTSGAEALTSASTDYAFQQMDADSDQRLSQSELSAGLDQYYFSQWDTDDDGVFRDDEVGRGLFGYWDTDASGAIDYDEWTVGIYGWMSPAIEVTTFEDWDADGDQELTATEFTDGMTRMEIYDSFDVDRNGTIDRDELVKHVYTKLDTDGDGFIDYVEWNVDTSPSS